MAAPGPDAAFYAECLDRFERDYLAHLITKHRGNISEVARVADLSRQTCYRLMHKHGIRSE